MSDLDGTVTRSDVLGHMLPRVGLDWSHGGIAKLYANVERQGYKLIYLSSRSIAQVRSPFQCLGSTAPYSGLGSSLTAAPPQLGHCSTSPACKLAD